MKKRSIIILSIMVAVALIAGLAIYARLYHEPNYADKLGDDELYQHNYLLTVFGRNNSLTGSKEVLVVDTITKTLGGDTEVTFRIYAYEKESDLMPALHMTVEQIEASSSYEYMGHGTVTLVDDQFAGMVNMKPVYVK